MEILDELKGDEAGGIDMKLVNDDVPQKRTKKNSNYYWMTAVNEGENLMTEDKMFVSLKLNLNNVSF